MRRWIERVLLKHPFPLKLHGGFSCGGSCWERRELLTHKLMLLLMMLLLQRQMRKMLLLRMEELVIPRIWSWRRKMRVRWRRKMRGRWSEMRGMRMRSGGESGGNGWQSGGQGGPAGYVIDSQFADVKMTTRRRRRKNSDGIDDRSQTKIG